MFIEVTSFVGTSLLPTRTIVTSININHIKQFQKASDIFSLDSTGTIITTNTGWFSVEESYNEIRKKIEHITNQIIE